MQTFDRITRAIAMGAGFIGGLAVVGLMLNVVVDVFSRAVWSEPIPGSLEYVQYWWMITIAFAGWGLAQLRNEHIEAPLLYDKLPNWFRHKWLVLGDLLTLGFLVVLFYYSWPAAREAQHAGEFAGAHGTAIWPTRYWIPLAAAILGVLVLSRLIRAFIAWRRPEDVVTHETAPAETSPAV